MVSTNITLTNSQGLHMRPAGVFAREVAKFKSTIRIVHNGREIDGKSVMNIIAACIKCGAEIEIRCSGEDEQEALDKAIWLIQGGMGD